MFTDNAGGFFQTDNQTANMSTGMFGNDTMNRNSYANEGQQQQPQRKYKNKVFAPSSLLMVENAVAGSNDELEIDGQPVSDIAIIGKVVSMTTQNMRTVIELSDSTSFGSVTFFHKGDHSVPAALKDFEYKEDQQQWVRVYAFIRVYNDNKNIVGVKLEEIKNQNDVTNHFLKIFVAHNLRKKGVLNNEKLQA
jgi:hypothetical protein